jgi:hypothetical protein
VNVKHAFGRATVIAAAVTGLAALGLTGVASASNGPAPVPAAVPAPVRAATPVDAEGIQVCTIQSLDGHYLSAIDGGGRTTDVIETNRTKASAWEQFTLVPLNPGGGAPAHYGIQAHNGDWLTAVGGGGRTTDVIHSNATQLQAWETFTLVPVNVDWYGIQTVNGNFLTALNGGNIGSSPEAILSNETHLQGWEEFKFTCN